MDLSVFFYQIMLYHIFFKFELRKFQREKIKWFHILTHSSEKIKLMLISIFFSGRTYIASEIIDL